MKKLLCVPKEFSFSNVNVELKSFFEDVESFLKWAINKKGITEENAKNIIKRIKEELSDIRKIELDSLFVGVSGKNISEFFDNMKKYSFPNSEESPILINERYTIIVESTHNLRTVIPKKKEQARRYHLFFSAIDKYFKMDYIYLREFKNFFFQKYFANSNFELDKLQPKSDKDYANFPFYKNFIILIVTEHSFKSM